MSSILGKILPLASYPEEWGCLCEPEKGTEQGHLLNDGKSYGCNRNKNYIENVVNKVKLKEKALELKDILESIKSSMNYEAYKILSESLQELLD